MSRPGWIALLLLIVGCGAVHAQSGKETWVYSRSNSYGIFGEYSNDSSHILLGESEQRKLLNFGVTYSRRLVRSRVIDFQYLVEIRPVILESDPLTHEVDVFTVNFPGSPAQVMTTTQNFTQAQACEPLTFSDSGPVSESGMQGSFTNTVTETCGGRKWTFGEGLSPVGVKLNFRPRHRLQPVFTGLGGYMFSTEPIPVAGAGSFNFTFEFGAGVEFYRSDKGGWFGKRSVRAEYRYHHISNHDTAEENPGIDSGMLQVTYAFGR